MSLQYTFDSKGKALGVFVPLQEWQQIEQELKKRNPTGHHGKKASILAGIEKGLRQVRQIEKGKLKSISLKQLLNEL